MTTPDHYERLRMQAEELAQNLHALRELLANLEKKQQRLEREIAASCQNASVPGAWPGTPGVVWTQP